MKQKKEHKILNKVSRVIDIIFILSSIILSYFIITMDVLPEKYFYLFIGSVIFLNVINFILLWPKKIKRVIKIFTNIFCLLLSIIFIFVGANINKTINFLGNINSKNKIDEFYLVTLKNANYNKISDLENETIGLFSGNVDIYEKAVNKLKDRINFEDKVYKNLNDIWSDLVDKKISTIFISKSHYEKLEYVEEDYVNKSKIISTIKFSSITKDISKNVDVTKKPFNVYISGMDSYGSIDTTSNSDVNILVTINPITKHIYLTSIPRDYYVQIYNKTGYKDKLTHSSIYGIDTTVKTVEELLETDINYYVKVNFTTLEDLVDAIDGVTVENDQNFYLSIEPNYFYKKGTLTLNGKRALGYARERKSFTEGDRKRGEHQEQIITAIVNKVSSSKTLINNYGDILESFDDKFSTNMDTKEIMALIKMQLNDMASWTIESTVLKGYDSSDYTYSYGDSMKLYVMEPDADSVIEAINKINEVINEKGTSD